MNHFSRRTTGTLLVATMAFASAPAISLARTELAYLRTATSRTFDNHDGTYTAEIHAGPIHRMEEQGRWVALGTDRDTILRPVQTGYIEHFWHYEPSIHHGVLKYGYYDITAWQGWARFLISGIPDSAAITRLVWHSYQYLPLQRTSLPTSIAWIHADPLSAPPREVSGSFEDVTPYVEREGGWWNIALPESAMTLLRSALTRGWAALGIQPGWPPDTLGEAYSAGELGPYLDVTYRVSSIGEEKRSFDVKPQTPSICWRVLRLGEGEATLHDFTGRRVMDLHPGQNDIRHVSPGIYFLRSAEGGERSAVTKVVVQR